MTVSPDVAAAAAKGDESSISMSGDLYAAIHGGFCCGKLGCACSGRSRIGDGGGILGSGFEATYAGGGSECSDGGRGGTVGASIVAVLESEKVE